MTRLNAKALEALPAHVLRPGYDRAAHGVGIVHLGVGAFHRAHQALYADEALAAEGGDWRIAGLSLRRPEAAAQLNPQDGLYTLVHRRPDGPQARVIGAIAEIATAPEDPTRALALLTAPATRVVTLTVTEKAYGLDPATGGLDAARPDVAADLAAPDRPGTAVGWLVLALARRRSAGLAPFTTVCCDNLSENGAMLGRLVRDFAERVDSGLAGWIAAEAPFPSTMVDKIVPAATDATRAEARALTGFDDAAAVEAEPYSQWVIEDRFGAGRPAWEAGGALLVSDVRPHELMKLRMLNGAHSLIAYAGAVAGHAFVRDVMADPALAPLVAAHLRAAALTVGPVPGVDVEAHARALEARFANPAIAHRTVQIAMDGSQKLPQRLVAPARAALAGGLPWRSYAFALAAWMRFLAGRDEHGAELQLSDPLAGLLCATAAAAGEAPADRAAALLGLRGIFPSDLAGHAAFAKAVADDLRRIEAQGVREAARAAVSHATPRSPNW